MRRLATLLATAGLCSCTPADGTSHAHTTGGFPSGVAVASPLDMQPGVASRRGAGGDDHTSHYAWATGQIDQLLMGTLDPAEVFTPRRFFTQPTSARCFGPTMHYDNHPDGPDGTPMGSDPWPSLPSGDLGLWLEHDPDSGDACAAAQLNAQMEGVSDRSVTGLMGLASMLWAASEAGLHLPSSGDTLELTEAMAGLGIPDTAFDNAEISHHADGTSWTYALGFTVTDGSPQHVALSLDHRPTGPDGAYTGALSWQVDQRFPGGHCPSEDATTNGSLYYARRSPEDVLLNAREGMYCGHGAEAATTTDGEVDSDETYLLVDPSDRYTGTSGWANGFSIVGAQFDPHTLGGAYTYAWQAGYGDPSARILSVQIEASVDREVGGDAFFGFGAPIHQTDGTIDGFYCSWAAPGSTHRLQPYVQHQSVVFDPASGRFDLTPGGSHIVYAPTNACTYDGSPAGFWYDRDLDRTANEAAPGDIEVTIAGGATGLQLDLLAPNGKETVPEMIEGRGFEAPPL